jgi:hypothetical protein
MNAMRVFIVLIDHKIIDRNVSVQKTCRVRRLVPLNAVLESSKQGQSGACLVYSLSIVSENDTPMHPIWYTDNLGRRRRIGSLARRERGASLAG